MAVLHLIHVDIRASVRAGICNSRDHIFECEYCPDKSCHVRRYTADMYQRPHQLFEGNSWLLLREGSRVGLSEFLLKSRLRPFPGAPRDFGSGVGRVVCCTGNCKN